MILSPSPSRPHRRGFLARFRRDEKGVTAIEFAIVALPFFTLMFAIIETAIVFFVGQALETATADAARLIMTGQAQKQNMSQAQFKQAICDNMRSMIDCGKIKVDVRTYATFSGSATKPGKDEAPQFAPGEGGDIVVVRASYAWPIVTSLMGLSLADQPDGKRLVAATAAFRNEPFE